MNATCYPVNVVFYGHSFVRRLQLFMNREETRNFGLCHDGHCISLVGQGGMTTAHLEQKIHLVGRMGPRVVFLDIAIGTNDLSSGYPIARLVERVLAAARILISFYHVKQVVILEIFRRLPTGRYHCPVDFNDRVVSYNTLLKEN